MTADRAIHKAALRRKRDRRGINSSVAASAVLRGIRANMQISPLARAVHQTGSRRLVIWPAIRLNPASVLINVAIRKIPRLHSFRFPATPSISAKMTEHCVLSQECGRRNSVDVFCDKNSASVYGPSRSGGVR